MVVGCRCWAVSHFFNVCWNRSTLPQVVGWFGLECFCTTPSPAEFGLEPVEAVPAGPAAGEPGGEDHAIVRQHRGGNALVSDGLPERGHDCRPGHRAVAAD